MGLSLLCLWYTAYETSGEKDIKYYLMRNTIAFYLGWVVGATILSLGIVLVHVYGMNQETFAKMFWVIAPTAGVFVTILNYSEQGMDGLKSCLAAWLSITWAMTGAAIKSRRHL